MFNVYKRRTQKLKTMDTDLPKFHLRSEKQNKLVILNFRIYYTNILATDERSHFSQLLLFFSFNSWLSAYSSWHTLSIIFIVPLRNELTHSTKQLANIYLQMMWWNIQLNQCKVREFFELKIHMHCDSTRK